LLYYVEAKTGAGSTLSPSEKGAGSTLSPLEKVRTLLFTLNASSEARIPRIDGNRASRGPISRLGGTRDDAAGKPMTRLARLLAFGISRGPVIDQLPRAATALSIGCFGCGLYFYAERFE